MNRYILIPEDTIRVLPPEDGAEAAIEIFAPARSFILKLRRFWTCA